MPPPNANPDPPAAVPPGLVRLAWWAATALVICLLGAFVVRTYARTYDPAYGWTKTIAFGQDLAWRTLPRLRRTTHYIDASSGGHGGYDGQFYAQIALDPSLRDPDLRGSLDMPAYRARRIGMPAASFALGLGNRWRVLQAYALFNPLCWFVLTGAMCFLLRPRRVRALLCLGAGGVCPGVIASMERSLVDLPATALLFAGLAVGSLGGCALLASAVLTRETALLGVGGLWDGRPPWREGGWKRLLVPLAAAVVPLCLWLLYVNRHLGHDTAAGVGNFALPLHSMAERFAEAVRRCARLGGSELFNNVFRGDWLYTHYDVFELLTVVAIFFQGSYLALRRDWRSPFWRVGAGYLALGLVLGPSVWDDTSAAARVLLPMTICFYLQLARERSPWWFWPFFLLGGVSMPYALHDFWVMT